MQIYAVRHYPYPVILSIKKKKKKKKKKKIYIQSKQFVLVLSYRKKPLKQVFEFNAV